MATSTATRSIEWTSRRSPADTHGLQAELALLQTPILKSYPWKGSSSCYQPIINSWQHSKTQDRFLPGRLDTQSAGYAYSLGKEQVGDHKVRGGVLRTISLPHMDASSASSSPDSRAGPIMHHGDSASAPPVPPAAALSAAHGSGQTLLQRAEMAPRSASAPPLPALDVEPGGSSLPGFVASGRHGASPASQHCLPQGWPAAGRAKAEALGIPRASRGTVRPSHSGGGGVSHGSSCVLDALGGSARCSAATSSLHSSLRNSKQHGSCSALNMLVSEGSAGSLPASGRPSVESSTSAASTAPSFGRRLRRGLSGDLSSWAERLHLTGRGSAAQRPDLQRNSQPEEDDPSSASTPTGSISTPGPVGQLDEQLSSGSAGGSRSPLWPLPQQQQQSSAGADARGRPTLATTSAPSSGSGPGSSVFSRVPPCMSPRFANWLNPALGSIGTNAPLVPPAAVPPPMGTPFGSASAVQPGSVVAPSDPLSRGSSAENMQLDRHQRGSSAALDLLMGTLSGSPGSDLGALHAAAATATAATASTAAAPPQQAATQQSAVQQQGHLPQQQHAQQQAPPRQLPHLRTTPGVQAFPMASPRPASAFANLEQPRILRSPKRGTPLNPESDNTLISGSGRSGSPQLSPSASGTLLVAAKWQHSSPPSRSASVGSTCHGGTPRAGSNGGCLSPLALRALAATGAGGDAGSSSGSSSTRCSSDMGRRFGTQSAEHVVLNDGDRTMKAGLRRGDSLPGNGTPLDALLTLGWGGISPPTDHSSSLNPVTPRVVGADVSPPPSPAIAACILTSPHRMTSPLRAASPAPLPPLHPASSLDASPRRCGNSAAELQAAATQPPPRLMSDFSAAFTAAPPRMPLLRLGTESEAPSLLLPSDTAAAAASQPQSPVKPGTPHRSHVSSAFGSVTLVEDLSEAAAAAVAARRGAGAAADAAAAAFPEDNGAASWCRRVQLRGSSDDLKEADDGRGSSGGAPQPPTQVKLVPRIGPGDEELSLDPNAKPRFTPLPTTLASIIERA